ncbi:MAG: nuclease-related domain-containing protein [Silanimonas sp.]
MTSILLPLVPALLVMIIGAVVAAYFRHPTVRGRIGERRVDRALRESLDGSEYRIHSDVILPSLDGTTQIDHVVVSRFGVFVIETKNLSGLVVGGPRDAQWTQFLGRRRHRFQNPLRQNYRHAKAIEAALGVGEREIVTLVVLAGDCRVHPDLAKHVTTPHDLATTIRRHSAALREKHRSRQ